MLVKKKVCEIDPRLLSDRQVDYFVTTQHGNINKKDIVIFNYLLLIEPGFPKYYLSVNVLLEVYYYCYST